MKQQHAYRCCLALSIAVLINGRDVLSASTEKSQLKGAITPDENERAVAKRQTSFQDNDFGQQQVPQDYFEFVRQTDAAGNEPAEAPRRPPPFGQQNARSQPLLGTGIPSDVTLPPRTTTTLSPFALEQQRLQEEYARRVLVEQLTALNRPRTRRPPAAQPAQLQPQFQLQAGSQASQQLLQQTQQQPQQQRAPLRFLDLDGQVRDQEFVAPQQQDFAAAPQQDFVADQQQGFAPQQPGFAPQQPGFASQQPGFAPQQQDLAPQQPGFAPQPSNSEPFSYASVQFGPVTGDEETPTSSGRPKGQRSVSRPRTANHVRATDALTEQSIDRPVTTVDSVPAIEYPVTTIGPPGLLSARQLQNVVYIQPNGQMYKPIEDVEQVVQIPRRVSLSTASSTASTVTTTAVAAPSSSAEYDEDQRVVLIPQPSPPPKKSAGPSRSRPQTQQQQQEGRKAGRARPEITLQQHHEQQHQQNLRQHHNQQPEFQSSEVEPDNFVTSLLSRLQQQHHDQQQQVQPEGETVAPISVTPRPRGRGSKAGGHRSESSKYLADRNQLQLLQFPHELKALSTAELKALEDASVQIAAANDKSVGLKKNHLQSSTTRHGRPSLLRTTPLPPPQSQPQPQPSTTSARLQAPGNRPVPTPVELNEQQRQFLASQGIRHLYRVDYDQSGNILPLTYVLALDNRPKRTEQDSAREQ